MRGRAPARSSSPQAFTLVGATTRAGLLTTPLRDRFGIPLRLEFYTVEELERIVRRNARVLAIAISDDGANEIARRARGTPRIAGRLLRRVRDFAAVDNEPEITRGVADKALRLLDVDAIGLDTMDRRYLETIAISFGGGPAGIETIAAACPSRAMGSRTLSNPSLSSVASCNAPARQNTDAARLPPSRSSRTRGGEAATAAIFGGRRRIAGLLAVFSGRRA